MELAERAQRLLEQPEQPNKIIIEEPTSSLQSPLPGLDPLTFILLLPVLPFYLLFTMLSQQGQARRRFAVTEIDRTPTGGWRIFEYEK